jgi:REP element-mobilizing transposase RayT
MGTIKKERYRRNLPHIQPDGGVFFVTCSLHGSIPASRLEAIKNKYLVTKKGLSVQEDGDCKTKTKATKFYIYQLDQVMDNPLPSRPHYLRDERIAKVVADSLHFWDDLSIELYCYCIMSNHLHTVIRMLESHKVVAYKQLHEWLHSVKRYSAYKANNILRRKGPFWMHESFDYLVRNRQELGRIIEYVLDNPVKAGLCKERREWRWTYIKDCYNEFM